VAVRHLQTALGLSERRACAIVGQNRSTQRHEPEGRAEELRLRQWLRDYAAANPAHGFHRAYRSARAEGWMVNHKRIQRLWRDEGLTRDWVGSSARAAAARGKNWPF
jgi:hypothetical protein